MNTKLSKFDKLMMAITFAEANAWDECEAECGAPATESRKARDARAFKSKKQDGQLGTNALKAGC